jgi:hypothetical protein
LAGFDAGELFDGRLRLRGGVGWLFQEVVLHPVPRSRPPWLRPPGRCMPPSARCAATVATPSAALPTMKNVARAHFMGVTPFSAQKLVRFGFAGSASFPRDSM